MEMGPVYLSVLTLQLNPEEGDLWWNSSEDDGRLYVYYTDANSSQWVEASPKVH